MFDDYVEYAAMASRHLWRASGGIATSHRVIHANCNSPVVLRAPMEAQGHFALECAMDELAYATGVDPVELRLRNAEHTDSPLYPIIGQMGRAAGFAQDDMPQARLDKLDALLTRTSTSKGPPRCLPTSCRFRTADVIRRQPDCPPTPPTFAMRTSPCECSIPVNRHWKASFRSPDAPALTVMSASEAAI